MQIFHEIHWLAQLKTKYTGNPLDKKPEVYPMNGHHDLTGFGTFATQKPYLFKMTQKIWFLGRGQSEEVNQKRDIPMPYWPPGSPERSMNQAAKRANLHQSRQDTWIEASTMCTKRRRELLKVP
jgi:hypothetical protein